MVETFGTEKVPSEQLTLLVREFFDLRPYGLIQMLDLLHPIYKETAAYGHFGREHFPWKNRQSAAAARCCRSEVIFLHLLSKASLALAFFFYLTAVDRHSRRIRQKAARTITSFFLNTFYRKLSSLLKPITPITPAKYL